MCEDSMTEPHHRISSNVTLMSQIDAVEHPGLVDWRFDGERGLSSNTLAIYLVSGITSQHPDYPMDSSDFRRCEMLLRAVPTLRPLLPSACELSLEWAAIIRDWDELVAQLPTDQDGNLSPHGTSVAVSRHIREAVQRVRQVEQYLEGGAACAAGKA